METLYVKFCLRLANPPSSEKYGYIGNISANIIKTKKKLPPARRDLLHLYILHIKKYFDPSQLPEKTKWAKNRKKNESGNCQQTKTFFGLIYKGSPDRFQLSAFIFKQNVSCSQKIGSLLRFFVLPFRHWLLNHGLILKDRNKIN